MADDYLWDRTGPVDAEVADLERALGRYGAAARPPAPPVWPTRAPEAVPADVAAIGSPALAGLAAAAVLLLAVGVAWIGSVSPLMPVTHPDGWVVAPMRGRPQVADAGIDGPRLIRPGTWIDTDTRASARLDLGGAGRVVIAPDSRVRITRAESTLRQLHLAHGTLEAFIWAPPGQVVVTTPAATAVDLGCAYTLSLDREGDGVLRVTSGWVGLVHDGREALVPAGALVGIHAGVGPGTPVLVSATPELHDAVRRFDDADDPAARAAALDAILTEASPGDALTLWHLLSRVAPDDRLRVHDALASRLAPPDTVTRDGIAAGDQAMIDDWWAVLGYGDRGWWRLWLREWRPAS